MRNHSFLLDLLLRLGAGGDVVLLAVHEADEAVLLHLGRALVAGRPHVANVLAVQTPHGLPLEHVVLRPRLKLALLARLLVEGVEARQRLRVEVGEGRAGRPLLQHQRLPVLQEPLEAVTFDLHLLIDLSAYLLSLLLNIGDLMLVLLLQHCFLLPEEVLLLILPAVLHLDPVQLVGEQPLRLLQQLRALLPAPQQVTLGDGLNLKDALLIMLVEGDGALGGLVAETEGEDQGLQHDDLAEEGVFQLQLEQFEVLQEFKWLAVVLGIFLGQVIFEVRLHLFQRGLNLPKIPGERGLAASLARRDGRVGLAGLQLSQIHEVLLHVPELLVELVGDLVGQVVLHGFLVEVDLLPLRRLGGDRSVVKPTVVCEGQEAGEREVQLPSNAVVLGLRDALEQVVDDPQQLGLLDFLEAAGEGADLVADQLQHLGEVAHSQALEYVLDEGDDERALDGSVHLAAEDRPDDFLKPSDASWWQALHFLLLPASALGLDFLNKEAVTSTFIKMRLRTRSIWAANLTASLSSSRTRSSSSSSLSLEKG